MTALVESPPAPPEPSTPPPATFLGRMASALFRHRRVVVAAWLLLLVAAALGFQAAGSYVADYATPGSGSERAATLLAEEFGGRTDQSVDVVYRDDTSATRPEVVSRIDALLADAGTLTGLQSGITADTAQVSADGRTAIVSIPLTMLTDQIPGETGTSLLDQATRISTDGLTVAIGGAEVGQATDASSLELPIGIGFAVVVLILMFGGLVAAGLPLVTSLFGLGVSVASVGLLTRFIDTPDWSLQMATMIGLGVGIDYALLVLTRHKAALARGLSPHDATVEAMSTAGRSVIIAGATVVISLLGLFFMGLPYLYAVAIASSLTVLFVLAATVTLLPALLGFAGLRINGLKIPGVKQRQSDPDRGRAARWARWVQRRPVVTTAVASVALVLMALPVLGIRFGFPDAGNDASSSTTRVAYDLVTEGFGPGANGPLLAVAATPDAGSARQVEQLRDTLTRHPGVAAVSAPVASGSGAHDLLVITPTTSPQDRATQTLVDDLRHGPLQASGLDVALGGRTAAVVDQGEVTAARLPLFIGGVLVLAFLLLITSFRAPIIALKAGVMNLLSIGAAYGVVALVAQGGWAGQLVGIDRELPIPPFIPVIMFAALFGLSMDYEVFLMSRIKEELRRTGDARQAVVNGMARTSRVITAAAAIMVLVFAAFAATPDVILKLIGIGLGTAILVDATIVRMVLVPAVMQLLGAKSWWTPRWLDRILPAESHHDAEPEPVVGDDDRRAEAAAIVARY